MKSSSDKRPTGPDESKSSAQEMMMSLAAKIVA